MTSTLGMNLRLSNLKSNSTPSLLPLETPLVTFSSVNPLQNKIVQIAPGLFLGDYFAACNQKLLSDHQIDVIVNLTGSLPNKYPGSFHYETFSVQDDPTVSINEDIGLIIGRIHQHIRAEKRVFIHCRMAISRAPSIAIGYLMRYLGLSFDEAYDLVKAKKQDIEPNLGFVVLLQSFN